MNFFTTPNSKNVIAALPIVLIKKPELTFFLNYISMEKRTHWDWYAKCIYWANDNATTQK